MVTAAGLARAYFKHLLLTILDGGGGYGAPSDKVSLSSCVLPHPKIMYLVWDGCRVSLFGLNQSEAKVEFTPKQSLSTIESIHNWCWELKQSLGVVNWVNSWVVWGIESVVLRGVVWWIESIPVSSVVNWVNPWVVWVNWVNPWVVWWIESIPE